MKGTVRIGTSGWSYRHWKGRFYPPDIPDRKMLAFYFQFFRTVETNSSFYHLPLVRTFENWRDCSPPDFVFSVKASRYITHVKKLNGTVEAVARFFERTGRLGQKTGPILFQLPPGLKMDPERLDIFMQQLPPVYRYAFEFRNASWFHPEVYAVLSKYGAAFAIYELGGGLSPLEVTAEFVYVRLHGPDGPYRGGYSRETLAEWGRRFDRWADESRMRMASPPGMLRN